MLGQPTSHSGLKNPVYWLAILIVINSASPLYADSENNMVESIMKLRSDVEMLYSKVQEKKDTHKAQIKSYAIQKADLEVQINRQETTEKQLSLKIQNTRKEIQQLASKNEDIKPLLLVAIEQLKTQINAGLPFKLKQRNADLDKIKSQLEANLITQETALSRVWSSYEDAIRLTRENGIFKQQVTINNEPKLCDVVKLGSIMLFFKTPDGMVGYASKNNHQHRYELATKEREKTQIKGLFTAMKKQIRSGYFTLPGALVLMEEK